MGVWAPTLFTDWLREIDDNLELFRLSPEKWVCFAKMKLIGKAKLHLQNMKQLSNRRRQSPIIVWVEMKKKLKERYIPFFYQVELLDDWNGLRRGSEPVVEYIKKVDEFKIWSGILEDETATLSRFGKKNY